MVQFGFYGEILFTYFSPVFNVTDQDGNKITDVEVLDYIQKVSCFQSFFTCDFT